MASKLIPNSVVHEVRRSPLDREALAERFGLNPRTVSAMRNARERYLYIVTPGWACRWPRKQDVVTARIEGVQDPEGHWIWTGQIVQGLPVWRPGNDKNRMLSARKAIWLLHRGEYDQDRYLIKRRCRDHRCVNPWHAVLELHPDHMKEYTFPGQRERRKHEALSES